MTNNAYHSSLNGISEILNVASNPDILSFAGGVPDHTLFPLEALISPLKKNALAQNSLQYAKAEGYDPLRYLLLQRFSASTVDLKSIIIVSGSQQALDLIGKLFIQPGARVIVTRPTYLGALMSFSAYQPKFIDIECDEEGIDLNTLEVALTKGAAFIYLNPDFQNPTGMSFSSKRRHDVVKLASKYRTPIIEDSAYQQLNYSQKYFPSLSTYADASWNPVLHVGTFSKTIAPGLRLGWIIAQPAWIKSLSMLKQSSDLYTGLMNQILVEKFLETSFETHLFQIQLAYKKKRDCMLEQLALYMPKTVLWSYPEGGFFIWLELPKRLDGQLFCKEALTSLSVAAVPGSYFYSSNPKLNTVRLSFSTCSLGEIKEGIKRLGFLIEKLVAKNEK